ncbi:ABC transporter substrate-binding protein [Patescibacteria group bacterium]
MKKPSTFVRVLKSYSGVEKIVSIILVVAFVAIAGKYVYGKLGYGVQVAGAEGIYTEGFQTSILRINPVYADLNASDRDVSELVFTGLTKYDPSTKKIVADMADVVISEDHLTYIFTLRSGLFWHDGEAVTSDDVYFTFHDVVQAPDFQNPILKSNFEGIEITKIDEMSVSFKLSAPNSFFITNTNVGILPQHVLGDVLVADLFTHEFNFNPIGTGPYKISSPLINTMTGVTQVVLEQSEYYYDVKPQIQNIRFFGYPTRQVLLENKNSINAIAKLTDEAIESVSQDSRFSLYGYSLPQYNAVFMNMENPNLKSLKVRQALQKAIFKDAFREQIPNTIPVETPVLSLNQIEWRYKANMDDAMKLLDNAGFKEFVLEDEIAAEEAAAAEEVAEEATSEEEAAEDATTEEVAAETDTVEIDEPVVEEATEEVTEPVEEELPEEEKTILRKNAGGQVLEFRLIARLYPENTYKYTETATVLNYLEENWSKAGVKLNIELYDSETLQEKIRTRDYDMLLFGQGLGYNLDLYGYWHSTQASETGLNLSNYKSFQVDTLIEQIRNTFNDEEKLAKSEQLAKVIQDDIPAIFLYRPVYYYASDGKVSGIQMEDLAFPADRFCRLDEWYFN